MADGSSADEGMVGVATMVAGPALTDISKAVCDCEGKSGVETDMEFSGVEKSY